MTIQPKSRGQRMKINGVATPAIQPTVQAGGAAVPAPAAASASGSAGTLESAVLQPAQRALRALPDFDAARVAELRDALAKGELPFDAGRLAGLIERFHGGKP
jgi:negative regulator of flagellin synthesis FlgM